MTTGLCIADLYRRATRQYPERIALREGERALTYASLEAQARACANTLSALGVSKGDCSAFLMANCPEYVVCEYALAVLGLIRVPLAVLLSEEDHIYMLNSTRARVLIYHVAYRDRVIAMRPRLETVEHFVCIGAKAESGEMAFAELVTGPLAGQAHPPVDLDDEDIAGIYFTGGTTGRPKGVMLSHRAWVQTCLIETMEYGIEEGEAFVFCTPLTHAAGCFLLPILLRGGRCELLKQFEPRTLVETVRSRSASATLLVPTMIYLLLDYAAESDAAMPSLKNVLYGAAPMAPERLRAAMETFGNVFTQFYGQTEAPMALCVLSRAEHREALESALDETLASAGRPTLPVKVRIIDDDGAELPRGEAGEIVVSAPNMMSGYFENPEATQSTIRNGWLYTGDIGRLDDRGLLHIVDRKKDVVITGGFNVYPREIEDVLFEHPQVANVAVIGLPHEKWGEEVVALVVPVDAAAPPLEREVIDFVKARKGSLVCPKRVIYVSGIPLTNLGKVDKKKLRSDFGKG